MKRTLITCAALAAIAILGANPASSATTPMAAFQQPATVRGSYDVGAGGTLRVEASFGSIEVTASSGNSVDVKVVREVRDRFDDDEARIISEHQVEMSQSGSDIIVTTTVSDAARDRWNEDYNTTPLNVRLEISVPRAYNVDLDTRAGNISVNDLDGEVRTETGGGNLEFGNINGSVWAHTAGGNIDIGDVDGNVDVETSGGNIHIDRAGGEVRAETSGGNISANITRQPAGDCRLSTSAGTISVTLAAGIGVDIDASTSIGGVSSDFDVDGRVTRNSISGSINGGGPELHLRTSAGRIRIRER